MAPKRCSSCRTRAVGGWLSTIAPTNHSFPMASLGHVAIGVAAARLYSDGGRPRARAMAAWSALSLLPDADVIGFPFGVHYADPWGHRGATHSFAFALGVGSVIGLVAARRFRQPLAR